MERADKCRTLWILKAAAYGFVNANTKWQTQSDNLVISLGLHRVPDVPQLLFIKKDGKLVLPVVKIVDDLLLARTNIIVHDFISSFDSKLKFGTVKHGPVHLRFFGLNILQHYERAIKVNANDKLRAIEQYPLTRPRRLQYDHSLTAVEQSVHDSVNCSIGWIGSTASLFCAEFAIQFRQRMPNATVNDLIS